MVHTLYIYIYIYIYRYHSKNVLGISDLPAFNMYVMVMVIPGMSHANICSRPHDQQQALIMTSDFHAIGISTQYSANNTQLVTIVQWIMIGLRSAESKNNQFHSLCTCYKEIQARNMNTWTDCRLHYTKLHFSSHKRHQSGEQCRCLVAVHEYVVKNPPRSEH
jgi:hypothetical protein